VYHHRQFVKSERFHVQMVQRVVDPYRPRHCRTIEIIETCKREVRRDDAIQGRSVPMLHRFHPGMFRPLNRGGSGRVPFRSASGSNRQQKTSDQQYCFHLIRSLRCVQT